MYYSKIFSFALLSIMFTTGWLILSSVSINSEGTHSQLIQWTNQNSSQKNLKINSQTPVHSEVNENGREILNQNSAPPIKQVQNQEFEEWKEFWVPDVSTNPLEHYKINVTLRAVGQHTLIYSDLSTSLNPTFLEMNHSFETVIYPTLDKFYGSPPDIDDNDRVIILVFDIIDGLGGGQYVAGFFYPLNQYLNEDLNPNQQYSNEAEILCIDGDEGLSYLTAGDFETVAHEFQHMIHFGHDDDENIWLDEGASMFAEYIIGGNPFSGSSPYKTRFSSHPDVSLTYWDYSDSESLVLANYGASFAFFLYLAEHYGGSSIIQNIVTRSEDGILSVERALENEGYLVEFKEVFRNWTIANFLDDTSFANGTYGYFNISLSMSVEESYFSSALPRTENSVPYWGTDYLRFTSRVGQPFILEFQGESSSNFMVTAILTNDTTQPFGSVVIPIEISVENFGNFSIESNGISADEIVLSISSYTPIGKQDHNNDDPAPTQDYWFMINPMGIVISTGRLSFSTKGPYLRISDVNVSDQNEHYWQNADGATYTILTDSGDSTGINGNLTFNSEVNYWMSGSIDISSLSEDNQTYQIKYYFFNSTHSGCGFSELFSVEQSSFSSSSSENTGPTSSVPFPGFILVLSILAMTLLISNRRKN
ncbi:MAG: hypothetical protein JSW11_19225 [Candidatus Heimdallarchaeota archaeon]|nr:MAG: hypothetical protein JSW11_19225 [Candidatus Heimdallarchaeota archaeon]